jgi:hypothetical protein
VLHRWKAAHVWTYLTEQHQRRIRVNAFQDRQINPSHPIQRILQDEGRFICRLVTPARPLRAWLALALIRKGAQVGL